MLHSDETDGHWGDWGKIEECPPGQYAYGYALKSEQQIYEVNGVQGDNTAINAVKLLCRSPGANADDSTQITSTEGEWGEYSSFVECDNMNDNPMIGFTMRLESIQGPGDDTAANELHFFCKDNQRITADASTTFGDWTADYFCPVGKVIAGIQTRVEAPQGEGDDSALNGVRFVCKDHIQIMIRKYFYIITYIIYIVLPRLRQN